LKFCPNSAGSNEVTQKDPIRPTQTQYGAKTPGGIAVKTYRAVQKVSNSQVGIALMERENAIFRANIFLAYN
jgi:hypothetical protein